MSAAGAAWHALDAATHALRPRVPFVVDGRRVGSVAAAQLGALRRFGDTFTVGDDAVTLRVSPPERDAALAAVHAALRAEGLVVAWRDETYPIPDPDTLAPLARIERAASRFWGTLTFGAHATGWVAGADGRPARLWIAQRSFAKATDPGLYDNLIGGGVPAGQTPDEALVREGFEEAGLAPERLRGSPCRAVLRLARDIPEGFQHEWLHAYDVQLQPGESPCNQDGEVHRFEAMPVAEALALARGREMTVDAALVTIDFAARHGLLADAAAEERLQALRVARPR